MADIILKDVCKGYQIGEMAIQAVDHVSFTVHNGEFSAVLRPSGAGKTTVLNLVGGMDRATGGQILVDGRDIVPMSDRHCHLRQRRGFCAGDGAGRF